MQRGFLQNSWNFRKNLFLKVSLVHMQVWSGHLSISSLTCDIIPVVPGKKSGNGNSHDVGYHAL